MNATDAARAVRLKPLRAAIAAARSVTSSADALALVRNDAGLDRLPVLIEERLPVCAAHAHEVVLRAARIAGDRMGRAVQAERVLIPAAARERITVVIAELDFARVNVPNCRWADLIQEARPDRTVA